MGKALSMLAPETVDQPPPATCIWAPAGRPSGLLFGLPDRGRFPGRPSPEGGGDTRGVRP